MIRTNPVAGFGFGNSEDLRINEPMQIAGVLQHPALIPQEL